MERIDREYTAHPFRGSRGMTAWLRREGHEINRVQLISPQGFKLPPPGLVVDSSAL
jgi:hypothetical protein